VNDLSYIGRKITPFELGAAVIRMAEVRADISIT